jgi:Mrp family chromosome partitioning ATPase
MAPLRGRAAAPRESTRDRLRAQLADLKMPAALEALDDILRGVDGGSLQAPAAKTLADFDFSFQTSIKREQIDSLHTLGFIERRENVILLGPPGVGKTHFAISLAVAAAQSGRRIYYGTLADLITSLEDAQQAGHLQHRMKTLGFSVAPGRRRDRLPARVAHRRHALFPTHGEALRTCEHGAHVEQERRGVGRDLRR